MIKIAFIVDNNKLFLKYRAEFFLKYLDKKKFRGKIFYFNKIKNNKKKFFKFISLIKKDFDIIYVIDLGNSKLVAVLILKIIYRKKIIVDIGDDYYLLNKNKNARISKLIKIYWIQKLFFAIANLIIVRGKFHKKYLDSKGYKKVVQIPDSVDLTISYRKNTKDLKKKLEIKNELIVGVMGSLNWNKKYKMCYGWDLVEALSYLKDLHIKGIIIGDGEGKKHLKQMIDKFGINDKIIFLGEKEYFELSKYLSLFDIGLSTQSNDTVGWFRTTGKLPEYLAHNIYIIATNVGEASLRIKGIGTLLKYSGVKDIKYPKRLAEKIKDIYFNRKILDKALKGSKIAERFFSYNKNGKYLEKIILNLFK